MPDEQSVVALVFRAEFKELPADFKQYVICFEVVDGKKPSARLLDPPEALLQQLAATVPVVRGSECKAQPEGAVHVEPGRHAAIFPIARPQRVSPSEMTITSSYYLASEGGAGGSWLATLGPNGWQIRPYGDRWMA